MINCESLLSLIPLKCDHLMQWWPTEYLFESLVIWFKRSHLNRCQSEAVFLNFQFYAYLFSKCIINNLYYLKDLKSLYFWMWGERERERVGDEVSLCTLSGLVSLSSATLCELFSRHSVNSVFIEFYSYVILLALQRYSLLYG